MSETKSTYTSDILIGSQNSISNSRTLAARTNNKAPFIGCIPWIDYIFTTLFWMITQCILLPFHILALPYSCCCAIKFKGKNTSLPTACTDVANISRVTTELKQSYRDGETRSYKWRVEQIKGLQQLLLDNDAEILQAYKKDLGKPTGDWFLEKMAIHAEAEHAVSHLAHWMQPENRWTPLWQQPGSSKIIKEPLGTVLVIGPYNYPMNLVFAPMIAAFSAGNNVMVKPSEQMPATAQLMFYLLPQYLSPHAVRVVLGGIPETTAILEQKWDKIFFTGSGRVAGIIEKKIAGTLTPCCFELGGKSPCIVDASANIFVACKRICQGKFANAGATCIAPDYVLVEDSIHDKFVATLKTEIQRAFTSDPKTSDDYASVLNEGHLIRLKKYVDDAVTNGATVVCGHEANQDVDLVDRFMAPTVLTNVSTDSLCMREEIFGPVLPVIKMKGKGSGKKQTTMMDEVIDFIQDRDIPLACYVFTSSAVVKEAVVGRIQSGSMCVNDAVYQVLSPDIPFGGVGPSGMGNYHGREGFNCFSHQKSVFDHDTRTDCCTRFRYPPFTPFARMVLSKLMGKGW